MGERQTIISRLINERDYRADYIRAKLEVLTQPVLAEMSGMKQSRISAMETPGRVNFNQETLVRIAATLKIGLAIKFIPFSEMLEWENDYSQDAFNVIQLPNDVDFLRPATRPVYKRARRNRNARRPISRSGAVAVAGICASAYKIPVQQQGSQMKFQFEPSEPPPSQARLAHVITLPNRSGSIVNNLSFLKTAAAAGAEGKYGTRQINR